MHSRIKANGFEGIEQYPYCLMYLSSASVVTLALLHIHTCMHVKYIRVQAANSSRWLLKHQSPLYIPTS